MSFPILTFAKDFLPELFKYVQPTVATVTTFNPQDVLIQTGSGSFLDNSHIVITNIHVLATGYREEIKLHSGEIYEADKVKAEADKIQIAQLGNFQT